MIGPEGVYDAKGSTIVAQAHIHLTPEDADKAGVSDGQRVSVTIRGERPVTFENVIWQSQLHSGTGDAHRLRRGECLHAAEERDSENAASRHRVAAWNRPRRRKTAYVSPARKRKRVRKQSRKKK
ncbi:PduL/EutD family phosphate acyltransferase [Hungatella sp.]|uniref:PduL/EutD family phosphate acyltransferase n=1 Tax=Hungatella sp. TaxID=2613924 RepID=UPI0039912C9C